MRTLRTEPAAVPRRTLDRRHLIADQELDPIPAEGPQAWRATGPNAQFVLAGGWPAGWTRVRLRLTATAHGRLELFADHGAGFRVDSCVLRAEVRGGLDGEFFVHLDRPVRGWRLDPLDVAGCFRLEEFRLEALSGIGTLWHAFRRKLSQMRMQRRVGRGFWKGLRLLAGGRWGEVNRKGLQAFHRPSLTPTPGPDPDAAYQAWRRQRLLTDTDRHRLLREIAAWNDPPRFSILVDVRRAIPRELNQSIESARRQLYPHWEWCAAEDWDAALATARGEYVVLLDPGDELAEHALASLARPLTADPGLALVYADEDRLTPDGRHVEPFFKPDWSPDYLVGCAYVGRPVVFRKELVRQLGGFRGESGQAPDHDLILRLASHGIRVGHVADVLCHRRRSVWASTAPRPVRFELRGRPTVSISIPSACRPVRLHDRTTFRLAGCVDSIRRQSSYDQCEILLLHNEELPPALVPELSRLNVRPVSYRGPFNWSRAMNAGAAASAGDHLLFLNDDVEVIAPDWIEALLEWSQRQAIGAVGAHLLFPDGRLQHAGVVLLNGIPRHPFYLYPGDHPGYFGSHLAPRNVSAVTGACLMTRANVFRDLGGFDEGFPVNYNDVDYCLRLIERGMRVVVTPYARLYHFESATQTGAAQKEVDAWMGRWGTKWIRDPYYNPNLSAEYLDYRISTASPRPDCNSPGSPQSDETHG